MHRTHFHRLEQLPNADTNQKPTNRITIHPTNRIIIQPFNQPNNHPTSFFKINILMTMEKRGVPNDLSLLHPSNAKSASKVRDGMNQR